MGITHVGMPIFLQNESINQWDPHLMDGANTTYCENIGRLYFFFWFFKYSHKLLGCLGKQNVRLEGKVRGVTPYYYHLVQCKIGEKKRETQNCIHEWVQSESMRKGYRNAWTLGSCECVPGLHGGKGFKIFRDSTSNSCFGSSSSETLLPPPMGWGLDSCS